MSVDFDVRGQQGMDFFTGGSDSMIYRHLMIKKKILTRSFSHHKTLIGGLDWSVLDYLWIIVMFLSAVWTLILTAPIHWVYW